ncbi:MAG: hypothetical protein L6264_00245 [Weeksellaceae bacterium]|nr:hypothetical protein [Weeksellaceae bacterium]
MKADIYIGLFLWKNITSAGDKYLRRFIFFWYIFENCEFINRRNEYSHNLNISFNEKNNFAVSCLRDLECNWCSGDKDSQNSQPGIKKGSEKSVQVSQFQWRYAPDY